MPLTVTVRMLETREETGFAQRLCPWALACHSLILPELEIHTQMLKPSPFLQASGCLAWDATSIFLLFCPQLKNSYMDFKIQLVLSSHTSTNAVILVHQNCSSLSLSLSCKLSGKKDHVWLASIWCGEAGYVADTQSNYLLIKWIKAHLVQLLSSFVLFCLILKTSPIFIQMHLVWEHKRTKEIKRTVLWLKLGGCFCRHILLAITAPSHNLLALITTHRAAAPKELQERAFWFKITNLVQHPFAAGISGQLNSWFSNLALHQNYLDGGNQMDCERLRIHRPCG